MDHGNRPKLDPRPARALTSREITKIIGATIGGLSDWCEEDDIKTAIWFWAAVLDEYTIDQLFAMSTQELEDQGARRTTEP